METPLETELIQKAQSGDILAFRDLVQRHDREVFAVAARYVSSAEDAKDIFQEVMIKIYRGLPGFRFQSEFSTWVHRITVNTCLTHRKQSKAALHVPLETDSGGTADRQSILSYRDSRGHAPDEAAIDADTADHVHRALQSLSPKQRIVFSLRHYQGHSLKEIAQALRCGEGTVKRYLFRATQRMREQLHHLL